MIKLTVNLLENGHISKNLFIFFIMIFGVGFSFISSVSAFDNETIQICGGDEQALILCMGDIENAPIGSDIYTAPPIIGSTGGAFSIVGSRFNTSLICDKVGAALAENSTYGLLDDINEELELIVSQGTLDQYINNFERMCNMTITKKQEEQIIKKVVFPFFLLVIIGILIYSYYKRIKIKKFVLTLFDDDD